MRFDDSGIFWEPFKYQKQKATKSDPTPRVLPPVPDTKWKPREYFPDLSRARAISLDTETYDPDLKEQGPGVRRDGYIVGVSLATEDGFKAYYPVAHSMGENLDKAKVFRYLDDQLSRPNQPKVGANILYDLDFLAEAGVRVAGPFYDVCYADPLIYEYEYEYNLDIIAQRRLGESKETSLLYQWCADAYGGKPDGDQRANIWRSPSTLVGPYAETDAVLPLRIIRKQMELLRAMGCAQVFEMECRLIPLLLRMRRRGVRVDLQRAQEIDDELSKKIDTLQKEVGIDVYAADQIQALCDAEGISYPFTPKVEKIGKDGLPYISGGNPSFTKKWLEGGEHRHPKLQGVSALRKFYKLRDAFVRNAILNCHVNGRVHCELHPLRSDEYGTVSGRYSSSHPNLQQIPARDPYWGPRIRSAFIPEDGCAWMKNDLSQIEFRLGVHFGVGQGIEEVRERYRRDHKTDFYNVCVDITGVERQGSKSISLGTLYGMGYKKLALMYGWPLEEAKEKYERFNSGLPFMRETLQHYLKEGEEFGFVRTIGGRVCHAEPEYLYKMLNRKLQGSCADWIKKSMLEAYESGVLELLDLSLTVHDELDSGVPPTNEGADAARELHRIMVNTYELCIPVLAGTDFGRNWGELEEIEPHEITADKIASWKR
jgi:DNA polymerase I-like protein with 3'-5' exonuclease and polymerase domains